MNEQDIIKLSIELVKNNIDGVFSSIKEYRADIIKRNMVKTGKAFEDYLISAVKKYSKVKTIVYGETPIFIYSTYTNIELGLYNGNSFTVENVSDLLEIDNNIIISGNAGSGKSTLLKYLFLTSIENGKFIPVFVELREINNTRLTLLDFIYSSLEKLNFTLEKEYFETILGSGKLIFYFDGLDEVSYEIKSNLEMQIIELSSKYNKNKYIVTSRPDENFLGWNTFTEMVVQNLTKESSKDLIQKINYYPEDIKNKFINELNLNLYNEYKSFASNPLLLTIMFISFTFNANISRKIDGFYEDAFEALFRRHDATKLGFSRKRYTDLDIRDYKKILSCFSLLSYSDSSFEYTSSSMLGYIDKSKLITKIDFDSRSFFLDMYKSLNIIIKDGLRYVFAHRTFQEYFSAFYISKLPESVKRQMLKKIFEEKPSDKVLDFLFEIDTHGLEKEIIIPYFEELKKKIGFGKEGWEYRYIKFTYNTIIINNSHEEYVSFLNNSNNAYNIIHLIVRLYFQSKWSYGSSEFEIKTKEIFASYASLSRAERKESIYINLDDHIENHVKKDIIELSEPKIQEFTKINEIVEGLKNKYNNQERTLSDILLNKVW